MPSGVGRTACAATCRTFGARGSAEAVSQKASAVGGRVGVLASVTSIRRRPGVLESHALVAPAISGQREVMRGRRGPRLPCLSRANPVGLRDAV